MNRLFLLLILSLLYSIRLLYSQEYRINDFTDFENQVNELEKHQQYDEALRLTKSVIDHFPDREFDILKEIIYINEKTEQYEKNLQIWEKGHAKGYFFLLSTRLKRYEPYIKFQPFDDLVKQDDSLRIASFEKSKTIWEVILPDNYSPENQYPLLLILHGGGSNLELAKRRWLIIPEFKKNHIITFIQSYRHMDFNTFGWTSNDERAHRDIKSCFNEIASTFSVDTTRIILSGISAGGTMCFDVCFKRILPVWGIIAFCPGMPWTATLESVHNLNTKFFVIGGEQDYYLPKQKELVELFKQSGANYIHTIIPGMGHEFPDNYQHYMRVGLEFINTD